MALPKAQGVRMPAVAGRFYPADAGECRAWAQRLVLAGEQDASGAGSGAAGAGVIRTDVKSETPQPHPGRGLLGGIVPHAGWICSGAVAGETIAALLRSMLEGTPRHTTACW